MKKDEILKLYKEKKKEEKPTFLLENDRVVVDEIVDTENRLHYVIKDGDIYTIELALGQKVKEWLFKPKVTVRKIHTDFKTGKQTVIE